MVVDALKSKEGFEVVDLYVAQNVVTRPELTSNVQYSTEPS